MTSADYSGLTYRPAGWIVGDGHAKLLCNVFYKEAIPSSLLTYRRGIATIHITQLTLITKCMSSRACSKACSLAKLNMLNNIILRAV